MQAVGSLVAGLSPGSFAFVMATGIVSTALDRGATRTVSATLLVIGLIGYLLLLAASAWRLLRWPRRLVSDLVGPRGFASLTVVAASGVLSARLAADGHRTAAAVLLAVGAAGWLLLGYGIPLAMIASTGRRPSLGQVNGAWFIWTVGTQSVAVACAALDRLTPQVWLAVLASVCWAIGIVQYLLTAALVLARLLVHPVGPDDVIPPYWVFMGAAAISVLAGTGLLALPAAQRLLPDQATTALCLVLWAFCTWLIPLLIGLGVWRHVLRRVPLRYETGLWSLVFPVGMYGVATRQLGIATGTSWLTAIGAGEAWVATAVWALVFLAMLASPIRASVSG
ncbi:tellurite resistance/C4-dicarboxylate transporter family protein [Kitasatospora sp. NPDC001159]